METLGWGGRPAGLSVGTQRQHMAVLGDGDMRTECAARVLGRREGPPRPASVFYRKSRTFEAATSFSDRSTSDEGRNLPEAHRIDDLELR